MNTQLQTLKGFRDFLPSEKKRRDYVAKKVIETFRLFGFSPLETPTLEYASLLLGKYGDEADKLLYKFEDNGKREVALRYDQTVPTARVLAQYRQDLPKYFRRYQIQNVFRADKPQKGRFREFTQCDIDIFGSISSVSDAEILTCTYMAFKNLGFDDVVLKVNDRNLLFEVLEPFSSQELPVLSIIQTIDKLDKIEKRGVIAELTEKGMLPTQAEKALETLLSTSPSSMLSNIIEKTKKLGVPEKNLSFAPMLARGLDYYTGMIFEISVPSYGKSSLGGGGRYDKLIEQLGGPNVPAVGVAFGFDRMVEALAELNLLPLLDKSADVLVTCLDDKTVDYSLTVAKALRESGVQTEVFPSSKENIGNQLKYASKCAFPFVCILGEKEQEEQSVTIKDMTSGKQVSVSLKEISSSQGDIQSLFTKI